MDFEFVKSYGLSKQEEITLLKTFVDELWKSINALKQAKEAKDIKAARLYSHKIQGSAGMVGLTHLASEAKGINELVHKVQWNWNGKLDEMIRSYPEIQRIASEFHA